MKFYTITFVLSCAALLASAGKVTFKQVKHSPSLQRRGNSPNKPNGLDLNTVHDLIYIVDINVGGKDYPVQLDTGSSDLWIKGATHPLPGWAYGTVAYAPVEFANLSIPSQALLDVSTAQNPALGYGVSGIVGLGFTSLSTVDRLVNISGQSTGRSLLYNMFKTNPQEPNFLAFALQRSTDADNQVEGSFSIGEYEPAFAAIANSTEIPTWPVNSPTRWNVLLDAVIVNGNIVLPTTTVVGAPSNKAVVLMDSGSSYSYAPKEICDAIYGNINGAYYDASLTQWVVPCDYEIDMALQIGGQVLPLHPLDVTPNGLVNTKICVGSLVPQPVSVGKGDFDWIIGVNFLRSVYSIYDFGDFNGSGQTGNPYMKFLSLINPDEASADFHTARGGVPKTNITYTGISGATAAASYGLSQDITSSLQLIGRYLPIVLGIVALNTLILIILVIAGTIFCCRRRRQATAPARTPRGRRSPMPLNIRHTYIPGNFESSQQPHTYEPVSMALTEDTFVPPSPAFHSFDGSRDRPKSIA